MSFRVVIPRSIPFEESNRVQREAWRRGYGTRLAGREAGHPERQVVEFLQVVEDLPEPSEVGSYATRLEQLLASPRIQTQFAGTGAWLETVQRPPHRATRA